MANYHIYPKHKRAVGKKQEKYTKLTEHETARDFRGAYLVYSCHAGPGLLSTNQILLGICSFQASLRTQTQLHHLSGCINTQISTRPYWAKKISHDFTRVSKGTPVVPCFPGEGYLKLKETQVLTLHP